MLFRTEGNSCPDCFLIQSLPGNSLAMEHELFLLLYTFDTPLSKALNSEHCGCSVETLNDCEAGSCAVKESVIKKHISTDRSLLNYPKLQST